MLYWKYLDIKKEVLEVAFINSFLSYLLLAVLFAAAAGIGIAVGIHFRKKKNDETPVEKES